MSQFKVSNCYWRRQTMAYHPVLGWWYVPELKARIPMDGTFYMLKTNSLGIRSDREYSLEKPAGQKRIVVLGDSYTAADGVDNSQRYTDLLEQKHPHLEVMNFGCPNTGTDQQMLIYEHLAMPYEADAVVMALVVENIARNLQTCRPAGDPHEGVAYLPKPYYTLEDSQLALHNQPVPLEKRFEATLGDWNCDFPYLPEYPQDSFAVYRFPERGYWRIMKAIIKRMFDLAGDKPVFMMPLPIFPHFLAGMTTEHYLARFKELEDPAAGHYLIDVMPHFMDLPEAQRQKCRFPNDPHYTALAQQVVARALEQALAAQRPDLLG